MIIYFGCRGTLIDGEGNLRRYADFVLQQLSQEGHRLYLWESEKDSSAKEVLKRQGLLSYFECSGAFEEPDPAPDYIIDANPDRFGVDTPGHQVPYFNKYTMMDDEEMLEVYRQIHRIMGVSGPPPRVDVSEFVSRRGTQ